LEDSGSSLKILNSYTSWGKLRYKLLKSVIELNSSNLINLLGLITVQSDRYKNLNRYSVLYDQDGYVGLSTQGALNLKLIQIGNKSFVS